MGRASGAAAFDLERSTRRALQFANLHFYFVLDGSPDITRLEAHRQVVAPDREQPTKGSDSSDIGVAEMAGPVSQEPVMGSHKAQRQAKPCVHTHACAQTAILLPISENWAALHPMLLLK
jgi:hypothetical protein